MFYRNSRRFILISLTCSCLFLLYFLVKDDVNMEYNASFDYECQENGSAPNIDQKHFCFKEPHVFFVETSGSPILNARQACAIESTAFHNPSFQMIVLMTSESIRYDNIFIKNLLELPNVQLMQVSVDVLVHNSPIFQWYRAGKWKKSQWKVSHLSDALRFLLMWKYGGMYLDLDIVSLQSMEHLKNSAITENWDRVAAGILIFDKKHELMRKCMFDFAVNYDPYNFVNNGPGVLTRNIKTYCDTNDIGKVSGAKCNIDILPPEAAFPIPYDQWQKYFMPSSIKYVANTFNASYLIHVWNKFSNFFKLRLGTNSLYEAAMENNCPVVHANALKLGFV